MKNKIAPDAAQTRCFFVPLFLEFHKNLKTNESISWIRVPTSLLFRAEFAALSLQSRCVFVSILLLCGLTASSEISTNIGYLSKVLSADKRTLAKALDELQKNSMLIEIDRKEIEIVEKAKSEMKSAKKIKAKRFVDSDCPLCSGNNETILNGRIVACPRCKIVGA